MTYRGRPPHRKLAILGAYGGVNIGDEMILRSVVLQARARGYKGTISVLGGHAPTHSIKIRDYDPLNLRFVSWRDPLIALTAVAGRDLLIGGGQVIDGAAGVKGPLMQLAFAISARLTGGCVTIGGVSTERLDSMPVRRAYGWLFRSAHRIATRDRWSMEDVVRIAPSVASRTATLADFAFSMRKSLEGGEPQSERHVLGFAVHSTPRESRSDRAETLSLLRRVLHHIPPGFRVAILAHDSREDYDLGLARRLADSLADDRVDVVSFGDVDECIAFYRNARAIISARMHPVILAACAGARCVPLESSRKVGDIAERLGVPLQTAAELGRMSDRDFIVAVGIANGGPSASQEALARLSAEAAEILNPGRLPCRI